MRFVSLNLRSQGIFEYCASYFAAIGYYQYRHCNLMCLSWRYCGSGIRGGIQYFYGISAIPRGNYFGRAFESKVTSIILSIVIAMWVWNARVVRTHVLRERSQPYVITCRMSGCSELRIVFRHIIPNILPHLLVIYSTGLSSIIIMISSYAFLGLGLETGTAEWGAMFVNANKLLFSHPELLVYPGLCILFAAAGFNLFGEALRDLCAPKEGS